MESRQKRFNRPTNSLQPRECNRTKHPNARMRIEEFILQSKRAMRHHLAARPVAEKLRMLDSLRERALAIRGHTTGDAAIRDEDPASCQPKP